MNTKHVRQSLTCGLAMLTLAALTTRSVANITIVNNPPPGHIHSVSMGDEPDTVTLNPDPLTYVATAPAAFQNLLNAYNGGYYAGGGNTINYLNPSTLNGTLTIDAYNAFSSGPDSGGGHLFAHYTPGAGDPVLNNLFFIQMVTCNDPLAGSNANNQRIDSTDALPFYPFPSPPDNRTPVGSPTQLNFTDWSERTCRPPHDPGADAINWQGDLMIVDWNRGGPGASVINVYDGVHWGWDLVCNPLPGNIPIYRNTSTLMPQACALDMPRGGTPIQFSVHPGNISNPAVAVNLFDLSFHDFTNVVVTPDGQGNEIYSFNLQLDGLINTDSQPRVPVHLQGGMQIKVLNRTGEDTGLFSAEILGMTLNGTDNIPGLGNVNLLLLEDPTLVSTGEFEDSGVIATDAEFQPTVSSAPFEISSFFDIFTELSISGGPAAPNLDGPTTLTLTPEPGSMSLAVLGAFGVMIFVRRRRGKIPAGRSCC